MKESYMQDEARFFAWLLSLLDVSRFDVVISVERKATAVLRALLDLNTDIKTDWSWERVLSSEALPYLPANWLSGKRILVFNEMVHHGRSTKDALDLIAANTPGAQREVYTAAFVVHDEFRHSGCWRTSDFRDDARAESPDFAVYRDVSDDLYCILRDRLLECLRHKGALLLDTEHIESTFSYSVPHSRFLDALGTLGSVVEYEQDEDLAPGVTLYDLTIPQMTHMASLLPRGADLAARAPQKIRLVRRGPDDFAFIPIWYPPVPFTDAVSPDYWRPPSYLQPALQACPVERSAQLAFHLAGLVAGLELIRLVWAALRPLVGRGVAPDTLHGSRLPGSPLGHLRALYPLVDFGGLETALAHATAGHKDRTLATQIHDHAKPRGRDGARKRTPVCYVDSASRHTLCRKLLEELIRRRAPLSVDDEWFDGDDIDHLPFTWDDFWETGRALNIADATRSIIMDTAIDSAILKTSHTIVRRDGASFIVRAFEPDSEFARQALEKLAYGAEELCAYA